MCDSKRLRTVLLAAASGIFRSGRYSGALSYIHGMRENVCGCAPMCYIPALVECGGLLILHAHERGEWGKMMLPGCIGTFEGCKMPRCDVDRWGWLDVGCCPSV